jgi:hypothetical protein
MIVVDQTQAGQTIDLPIGQVIELRLAENPTTGYRWVFVLDGAPACLVISDRYQRPNGPPGRGVSIHGRSRQSRSARAISPCSMPAASNRTLLQVHLRFMCAWRSDLCLTCAPPRHAAPSWKAAWAWKAVRRDPLSEAIQPAVLSRQEDGRVDGRSSAFRQARGARRSMPLCRNLGSPWSVRPGGTGGRDE